MKRLLASIFIALAAMFLVACSSLQQPTNQQPTNQQVVAPESLMAAAKPIDPDLIETRYAGSPKRDANGVIVRRQAVITAFWAQNICPSTLKYVAPCPGWALNHIIPLACGGRDAVNNLFKMQVSTKKLIDAIERKINAHDPPFPDTAACPAMTVPIP